MNQIGVIDNENFANPVIKVRKKRKKKNPPENERRRIGKPITLSK